MSVERVAPGRVTSHETACPFRGSAFRKGGRRDKLPIWTSFIDEMGGARKAELDDFNRRHKLTRYEAWLCETPGGTMVCAIHEGPGADEMMPNVSKSTHSVDQWFAAKINEIHGLDPSKGPPPGKPPVKKLDWTA